MASIIRRTYSTTVKGKPVTRRCKHYVVEYRDEAGKVKRYTPRDRNGFKVTHRDVAEAIFTDWRREQAREGTGLLNPHRRELARPLDEHRRDFIADLRSSGKDDKYIYVVDRRLGILADECPWNSLTDVTANSFMRWRDKERTKPTKRRGRDALGLSPRTLNHFLERVMNFHQSRRTSI